MNTGETQELQSNEASSEGSSKVHDKPLRVLQFICSTGFYGAEGWILALANNSQRSQMIHHLAVTRESENLDLELTRRFTRLNLPTHELPMSGRFDLRIVRQLVQLIREQEIDVIHTHGYKSDLLGVAAARLAGIASICTPHGFENAKDWKLRAFIRLGCESFRFFDRVVPLSPDLMEEVKRFGIARRRLAYIGNGVDLLPVMAEREKREQVLQSSDKLGGTDAEARVLGYIGQLIDRKKVDDILTVFDALASRYDDLRLVLVGDGDMRESLEQQAQRSPYNERIEFRGFVDQPLTHLSEFDAFVMTSSLEGIPRCLMEAMSMGVPVAAYDIPGVDQLIDHEQTGMLAQFGDTRALIEHCDRLLQNTPARDEIIQAARDKVEENFSAARMASEYLDIYRQVLAERAA